MATATSDRIVILWKVLCVAPNGLPQWVSCRAGTAHDAIQTALRHRPMWDVARDRSGNPVVERERNP